MYGLDAINANNGWSIAAVGIIIVFAGLVSLSLIISQLHRVLTFIEDPKKFAFFSPKKNSDIKEQYTLTSLSNNQKQSAKQIFLLIKTMDDHFSLSKLIGLAEITNLGKPYNNINTLIDSGIIEPDAEGYFLLNEERYKKLTI